MQEEKRICQNCKRAFSIEPGDFAFYDKVQVPSPTFCPLCRAQRRMAFYNIRSLYKRKDSRTGEEIFSMFAPESPVKVYDHDFWWSDEWDPMEYGREYDFSRPFFSQFHELLQTVPLASRSILNPINSDYCNNAGNLKNCYLVFDATELEDVLYSSSLNNSKECVDVSSANKIEFGYELFYCNRSSRIFFSSFCDDCFDVYFSKNLRGCSNCFGCVNLANKQYYIFNKPYSKEAYLDTIQSFRLNTYSALEQMKEKAERFWLSFPVKFMQGSHNSNVSGAYIARSKNVRNSYDVTGGQDLRYCQNIISPTKDSYDYYTWGLNAQGIYECSDCGRDIAGLKFCVDAWGNCKDLAYCVQCGSSSDLFGCVGLRKKQYCILDKQYTKEEYEKLVPKIIEHMNAMPYTDKKGRVYRYGEFFPIELSPFAYNETAVQEFFPLLKNESLDKGYRWKELEEKAYEPTRSWQDLPDSIDTVDDSLLHDIILCKAWDEEKEQAQKHNCTKVFRIIPQELTFYKKMNLPLPRYCPNSRHFRRIRKRNPLSLWSRRCMCQGETEGTNDPRLTTHDKYKNTIKHFHGTSPCPTEFETAYSPEGKEILYCAECYQAEIM